MKSSPFLTDSNSLKTMMLRKQQQQEESSPPSWWWLDAHNNNAPTRRSPWLQSTLSALDEKTTAMLKLIEADADSFAQRAEMYYKKRSDLISVVEEFYRMHRSLAERFDQMKTESATRLLKTLGLPFSCDERFCLGKSTSPVKYRNYDTCSVTSDDHEDNPESEVEDPEEDDGSEPTSPKDSSQGNVVGKAPTQGDGNGEMLKLRKEVEKLREENQMLRYEMARKDEERKEATGRLGVLMDDITRLGEENKRQIDEMVGKDDQKREALRQLTVMTDEMERLREQNKMQREQMACEDKEKEEAIQRVTMPSNEVVRFDEENKMKKDALKEENPSLKNQPGRNLGNPNDPFEPSKTEVGCFLRRLFPKSSNKCKATSALSFGTFH